MLNLMLITRDPEVAVFALQCGVNLIFVDLEILGKKERQGHLDTVISRHSLSDIDAIRKVAPKGSVLVRLNPLHKGTPSEVDEVLSRGADFLMLPMFKSAEELRRFSDIVDGRIPIIPLVETPQAMVRLEEILEVPGLGAIYIGLNDLHLGLGLDFMFEPLAEGLLDHMVAQIQKKGLPFGFGGIGRMDTTPLPGSEILAEHVRLGSRFAILSRSFHGGAQSLDELRVNIDFPAEILKLREKEVQLGRLSPLKLADMHLSIAGNIRKIALAKRETKESLQ